MEVKIKTAMKVGVGFLIVAVIVLVALAAAGVFAKKDTDTHCDPPCAASTQTCINRQCLNVACDPTCLPGEQCVRDPANATTTKGMCLSTSCSPTCQSNETCTKSTATGKFACISKCAPECHYNERCVSDAAGNRCVSKCEPACTEGSTCTIDGQCLSTVTPCDATQSNIRASPAGDMICPAGFTTDPFSAVWPLAMCDNYEPNSCRRCWGMRATPPETFQCGGNAHPLPSSIEVITYENDEAVHQRSGAFLTSDNPAMPTCTATKMAKLLPQIDPTTGTADQSATIWVVNGIPKEGCI